MSGVGVPGPGGVPGQGGGVSGLGGVVCLVWGGGGVPVPGGCAWSGGWCVWSGGVVCLVWGGGVSGPEGWCAWFGGVSGPGGLVCLVQGVCLVWGDLPQCLVGYHHPPCEQNDKQVQKYYLGHNFVAAGKYICDFQ